MKVRFNCHCHNTTLDRTSSVWHIYKLTVANYDRQANFKRDLLLFCRSSTHSITCSSRSQYASYGGRRRLSMLRCTGACDLEIAHMCYTIPRLPAQSRDSENAQCNLEIAHTCYAIPRLPAQSQDSENAQRNLEIVQIPRSDCMSVTLSLYVNPIPCNFFTQ